MRRAIEGKIGRRLVPRYTEKGRNRNTRAIISHKIISVDRSIWQPDNDMARTIIINDDGIGHVQNEGRTRGLTRGLLYSGRYQII